MAGQSERVHFTDGDRLDLRTLAAEQTFHLEAFRRHLLAAHSWGILSGLGLAVDEGAIVIEPGLAVDGYGRVLLLDRPIPIAAQAFVDRDTTELDVFLVYSLTLERSSGAGNCGGNVADRAVERPYLRLEIPDPARLPRSLPPGVPSADLAYDAERPPVQPNQAWPVFLGRARFDPEDNPPLAADPSGRRYGGVRAERVEAPSGTATLELGLGTDGASHVAWNVETALGVRTLLDIAADGQIRLDGNLEVAGDIRLIDGPLTLEAAQGSNPAPLPASLSLGTGRTPSGLDTTDLRITLPDAPQGGTSRFVVGAWSEDANSFQEIMTVEANGDVSLFGNLTQLPANTAPGQPKTQPGFDEASQRLIQAAMFNAIGATGTSIVNAIISGGDVGPLAKNLGVSGFMLGEFVAQILPEAQVDDFAQRLQERNPKLHAALADALSKDADGGGGRGG